MQVELKVRFHPSGRYTLMERSENEIQPRDCTGPLFGNDDAGTFYKAVALKLAQHVARGDEVSYADHS